MKKINSVMMLGLMAISFQCFSSEIELPKGWRIPAKSETLQPWRNENPGKYLLVNLDMNGDGIRDSAMLLIADKPSFKLALFVFLSQKDGSYTISKIDEKDNADYLEAMGIEKVLPGRYKTACGKGYVCEKGEEKEVLLRNDSISYFKYESAVMYLFWDSKSMSLKKAWVSD